MTPFAEKMRARRRRIQYLGERGACAAEIGRALGISHGTVRYHAAILGLRLEHGVRRRPTMFHRHQIETPTGFIDVPAEFPRSGCSTAE